MRNDLYAILNKQKPYWTNEEEIRISWVSGLSNSLGLSLEAERKNNDSSYNNVIIEFKSPGLFKGKQTSPAFKNAIYERLKPYILRKAEQDNLNPEEYIGIAIDGDHICFARIQGNEIKHNELLPFSPQSTSMVQAALLDSKLKAVTVENLVNDFSIQSSKAINCIKPLAKALSKSLMDSQNNKIKMLFKEWQALFGQIADLSKEQIKSLSKGLEFGLETSKELRIPGNLFLIHTYNSLIIKLLAAEILSKHELTSMPSFAEYIATLEEENVIRALENEIENSRLFEGAGIKGFVEEALFSWYLDACSNKEIKYEFIESIKDVLVELSFYRTDNLETARTQDILKGFYQSLVPAELRKSLGEYYTPDWLVEFSIQKLNCSDWLDSRFLDPTCGSASFLISVTKHIREQAEKKGLSPIEQLQIITKNVWGFDLNPLAVQTARLNFLISIADLLKKCSGFEIQIPILLADSVYSPSINEISEDNIIEYTIGSHIADLTIEIPNTLALDRNRLDAIFEIMGTMVNSDNEYIHVKNQLINFGIISISELEQWDEPLEKTYNRVLNLHKKNWNGIWFKIIRNFFWSATAGEFDYIVGNPPWVRWSNLPELYRQRVKPTCLQYEIFSSTPYHGGNELDISGMITYTVSDKWLKNEGKMVFVITQTHFQAPSSEGFRGFKINEEYNLIPIVVEDFKSLKPFADATNKTAVVVFEKSKSKLLNYPVDYNVWTAKRGYSRTIPFNSSLKDINNQLEMMKMEANPVTHRKSPWAILPPGRFNLINSITGQSDWVNGRKGITADLNGIYFVKIIDKNIDSGLVQIETRPEAGKKDIGSKKRYWVEQDFLYPLIKGAGDFKKYKFNPKEELYVFVPNKGIQKEHFEESDLLLNKKLNKTRRYFQDYSYLLKERSTWKLYLKNRPIYAVYNVGTYTFAPYKVLWAEQSKNFISAVATHNDTSKVNNTVYVPDHKVYYVDFHSELPAYYLCGLLNSEIVKEFVESHSISIQVGNIFKHMNLPPFDQQNKQHIELANLVKEAHSTENFSDIDSKITKLSQAILISK
ncbi:N-6 DNA methylase [Lysinibacillus sp. CNPSo 3705]|nr:N-6 DNA methylase [Lysinibacillus sp. CNPSo 3705]MDD1505874.1 N-6 DNA methylase [Lysinibacillus sp. CNPSo 3705]